MSHVLLVQAESRRIPLADTSMHCCITSPPYYAVRDYGTAMWEGGEAGCDHYRPALGGTGKETLTGTTANDNGTRYQQYRDCCRKCGAVRHDNQLGLEALHDCLGWATGQNCNTCYLCHIREVAREIWRVLRNDGTLWLNIGDTYNQGPKGQSGKLRPGDKQSTNIGSHATRRGDSLGSNCKGIPGLKPKSLIGIPQRLALALQADGWIWRSDIVWNKPSCMPESTTDRPTRSHEYVLLFSKRAKYYYDGEAIREVHDSLRPVSSKDVNKAEYQAGQNSGWHGNGMRTTHRDYNPAGRNARTVWTIPSEPVPSGTGHYASFPTALVTKMILAGSSAYGVCGTCGAPWRRQTAITGYVRQSGAPETRTYYTRANGRHGATSTFLTGATAQTTTTGWQPSCSHKAPVVPATILDPFVGSGTSLLAARALGRHAIGLDLSWPYLHTIARERLSLTALERWTHGAAPVCPTTYTDLPLFA